MINRFDSLYAKVANMYRATEAYEDLPLEEKLPEDIVLDLYAGSYEDNRLALPVDSRYVFSDYEHTWQEVMDYLAEDVQDLEPKYAQAALTMMKYVSLGLLSRIHERNIPYSISEDGLIQYHAALRHVISCHDSAQARYVNAEEFVDLCSFEPSSVRIFMDYPENFETLSLSSIYQCGLPYFKEHMRQAPQPHISKNGKTMMLMIESCDQKTVLLMIFLLHKDVTKEYFL